MRHALNLALQEYVGAVVLVSHDRHLLRTTVDELWLVAGGRMHRFDGDLDDYRASLREQENDEIPAVPARLTRRDERRERAQRQDEIAARRRPLERDARALEHEIAALEAERESIDAKLGASATYASRAATEIEGLHKRRAVIEARLGATEMRWYEVSQAIDDLSESPPDGQER
jgi:ATP-binding cassette subfamily F protein 3